MSELGMIIRLIVLAIGVFGFIPYLIWIAWNEWPVPNGTSSKPRSHLANS